MGGTPHCISSFSGTLKQGKTKTKKVHSNTETANAHSLSPLGMHRTTHFSFS